MLPCHDSEVREAFKETLVTEVESIRYSVSSSFRHFFYLRGETLREVSEETDLEFSNNYNLPSRPIQQIFIRHSYYIFMAQSNPQHINKTFL